MIVLFTDFGLTGPYVGQIKAVLAQLAPHERVIDLMHDAPAHDPRSAAFLLASLITPFAAGTIFCAVVDPGVGGNRPPVIMEADGRWFVGPGNGLFEMVRRRAVSSETRRLTLEPARLSVTFHGRDLFAPAAALLALSIEPPSKPLKDEVPGGDWPDDLPQIIYIDRFGNGMTGLRASALDPQTCLAVGECTARHARTFSEVPEGTIFWHENSHGLAELATNQGRAADLLNLKIGTEVAVVKNQAIS